MRYRALTMDQARELRAVRLAEPLLSWSALGRRFNVLPHTARDCAEGRSYVEKPPAAPEPPPAKATFSDPDVLLYRAAIQAQKVREAAVHAQLMALARQRYQACSDEFTKSVRGIGR